MNSPAGVAKKEVGKQKAMKLQRFALKSKVQSGMKERRKARFEEKNKKINNKKSELAVE